MKPTVRGTLTRSLAAVALVLLYGLSTIGISSFVMGTPKAEARSRGGRGGGGRGFRGRGSFRGGRGGFWWGGPALYSSYYYDDNCYWSPRRGRYVCPYAYYPDYYRYW